MNHTTNYHLPQWVETDRIMMGDFNDAMASIEEGLNSNAQAAASAQAAAAEKGYVIGSYTGNGTNMEDGGQLIDLGFQPKFLIISQGWADPNHSASGMMIIGESSLAAVSDFLTLEENGFRVGLDPSSWFKLNTASTIYPYVAFK